LVHRPKHSMPGVYSRLTINRTDMVARNSPNRISRRRRGVAWASLAPSEANAPLIVDADAVPAAPVAMQGFEPVTRWNSQIVQLLGRIYCKDLGAGTALNLIWQVSDREAGEYRGRAFVEETSDHRSVRTDCRYACQAWLVLATGTNTPTYQHTPVGRYISMPTPSGPRAATAFPASSPCRRAPPSPGAGTGSSFRAG